MIIKHNEPLAKYTTYKIGGTARELLIPESADDILTIAREYLNSENSGAAVHNKSGKRLIILGGGSNTLFSDGPVDAAVIKIGAPLDKLSIVDCVELRAEAGAPFAKVARTACSAGLTGLEWACGIPGTVGGVAVGNAGAFGGCTADVVKSVTVAYPGGFRELNNEQCGFTYRGSIFSERWKMEDGRWMEKGRGVITAVTFVLERGDKAEIEERINRYAALRRGRQPSGFSAGSVFKNAQCSTFNSQLIPAGLLLDHAGLKGARIGGAYISPKHANFIINDGTARFSDVKDLIEYAASVVWLKYGVRLETEIKIIES